MNYIWEFLIRAKEQNIDVSKLVFQLPKSYSPYMEMAMEDLNIKELTENQIIEINPYYRFYSVFKDIFNINFVEDKEIRERLFCILIHFIGKNDVRQGLCKEEYNRRFMWEDLKGGVFGDGIQDKAQKLTQREKEILLSAILHLYRTGTSIELFKEVVQKVFPKSIFYCNQEEAKEILIYIGEKKENVAQEKIELVLQLFARIDFIIYLYWEYHFGILDIEDTMHINEIVLY